MSIKNKLSVKGVEGLPKKWNISKNDFQVLLTNKKKFHIKKINLEFFIHLFLCLLSILSILKCKIFKIKISNYLISLKSSEGEIDYRSKYIINNFNLHKSINFVRSINFKNSIRFYIKQPNVVFFYSIEYFCLLLCSRDSRDEFECFHVKNQNSKKIIKYIFKFLSIKKFVSIDDYRVIVMFLEICEELNIQSIGYMHARFTDIYPGIKYNAFNVFFVWSDYFKKKLIQINNNYKNSKIIITGISKKIYKKEGGRIIALFVLDTETNFKFLSNLLLGLKKNKISIAVKFKPSSNINNDKWINFLKNNCILYFESETFLEIRNKYSITYFVAYSSTALYEACLYNAEPIIIKNNSKAAKGIIDEKIIKCVDNKYSKVIKFLKKKSNKSRFLFVKKKFWGKTVYNKRKIIKYLYL